jgi:hypothetical protein
LPGWVRQWEFWLVIGLAGLFRIPPLARSPFGSDDALLFLEAIRAVHDHLLPATSIFNSLLALNMPFYTWLLLPFATHPLGMAIVTDVADILTVGGLYLFGARYFGRVAGLVAGLLYATAMYPTWFSLFIWEPTVVPPLLLGVFITLYLGVVDGKRHWLPYHAILLAALIQVYPLAATILPLTLVGILLGWRAIHWLDIPLALIGPVLLFIPTYLFELASGGYDLHVYQQYLHTPPRIDSQVFEMLQQAIGALPGDYLGADTVYARVEPSFTWLGTLLMVLWAGSSFWLLCTLVFPRLAQTSLLESANALAAIRNNGLSPLASNHKRSRLLGLLHDRGWRARLLLAMWPLTFLAATIRHAPPIYIHYTSIVLPIIYLTIGFAAAQLPSWLSLTGGALVSAVQFFATGSFVLVLATGQAAASSWGGIPILSFTQAAQIANNAAEQIHSTQVYLVADPTDPYMGLYWAADQNQLAPNGSANWTSYANPGCALRPPGSGGPAVLFVMTQPGLALTELLEQPGTHLIRRISMARGADYPLYQIAPNNPTAKALSSTLNGELQFNSAVLQPAQGDLPARIVSYWTALSSTPPNPAVSQYSFKFLLNAPAAPQLKTSQTVISCTPSSWRAGEGIILAFPVPSRYLVDRGGASLRLRVIVSRDSHYWYQPKAGSLTLETAKELTTNQVLLPIGKEQGPGILYPTRSQIAAATIVVKLKQ